MSHYIFTILFYRLSHGLSRLPQFSLWGIADDSFSVASESPFQVAAGRLMNNNALQRILLALLLYSSSSSISTYECLDSLASMHIRILHR